MTLGDAYRHWFRAKFFQQYRLFFRYHAASRIIVYAWVNDEDTRRAYESADDYSQAASGSRCRANSIASCSTRPTTTKPGSRR